MAQSVQSAPSNQEPRKKKAKWIAAILAILSPIGIYFTNLWRRAEFFDTAMGIWERFSPKWLRRFVSDQLQVWVQISIGATFAIIAMILQFIDSQPAWVLLLGGLTAFYLAIISIDAAARARTTVKTRRENEKQKASALRIESQLKAWQCRFERIYPSMGQKDKQVLRDLSISHHGKEYPVAFAPIRPLVSAGYIIKEYECTIGGATSIYTIPPILREIVMREWDQDCEKRIKEWMAENNASSDKTLIMRLFLSNQPDFPESMTDEMGEMYDRCIRLSSAGLLDWRDRAKSKPQTFSIPTRLASHIEKHLLGGNELARYEVSFDLNKVPGNSLGGPTVRRATNR